MVLCNSMDLGSYRKISTCSSASSFRLKIGQDVTQNDDTASVYSACKQKIDSMFETESVTGRGNDASVPSTGTMPVTNHVQNQIENMFKSVEADLTDGAAVTETLESGSGATHLFTVKFVGRISLPERVTSLHGLQKPLFTLILTPGALLDGGSSNSNVLEISSTGLRWANDEHFAFSTIAVWSALKFVEKNGKYAFVPLISNPDTEEKRDLFVGIEADTEQAKCADAMINRPLFVLVTRVRTTASATIMSVSSSVSQSMSRRFDCHVFESETSEDAIVTAATLYKSLMAHLRTKKRQKVPKTMNGISCISVASSSFEKGSLSVIESTTNLVTCESNSRAREAIDAEHQKTVKIIAQSHICSAAEKSYTFDDAKSFQSQSPLEKTLRDTCEPRTEADNRKSKICTDLSKGQVPGQPTFKRKSTKTRQAPKAPIQLKTNSLRLKKNSTGSELNSGDIFTKVTIPRSGSFLNAGGLTRYKSKSRKMNGQGNGGSPLGFTELFNEFRVHEGLESIDEILAAIVNTNGMSFNDLKPIYKEFLLKLAMTLTKDELFQRSKAIMRQQRKKVQRKFQCAKSRKIIRHFKVAFKKRYRKRRRKTSTSVSIATSSSRSSSSMPASSSIVSPTTKINRKRSRAKQKLPTTTATTVSESDVSASRRHARNSSSGYVSFSECSYDSDSCTCVSADKCYCSIASEQKRIQKQLQWCKCDTDSCTDSNKCYCQLSNKKLKSKSSFLRKSHLMLSSLSDSSSSLSSVSSPIFKMKKRRQLSLDNFAVDYNLFKKDSKPVRVLHGSLNDFNCLTDCRTLSECGTSKPPQGFASRKVRNPIYSLDSQLASKSFDY